MPIVYINGKATLVGRGAKYAYEIAKPTKPLVTQVASEKKDNSAMKELETQIRGNLPTKDIAKKFSLELIHALANAYGVSVKCNTCGGKKRSPEEIVGDLKRVFGK